ncbi:hypothetical protein HYQ45_009325 [Verticillium longisporum]|uniref:Uncharacterized protein n=1 Tax=Verticillium longisporum TaxID=100787 RepID=A0A8I2ZK08_VERLO|nr:hypothetical protein HYQ45_009325 [Verticillium longisporum]
MNLYANSKVGLVPWDARSDEHTTRMFKQRVACGWRSDEVVEWREKQLEGGKFLYWVVLGDAIPGREKLLSDHLTTGEAFWPIGHLALEKQAEDDADMGLAKEGSVWIKHLYISWAIQAGGIGKASMQAVEALAKLEPLFGTTIVLDTAQKETQSSDEWKRFFFTDMGRPIPEPFKTKRSGMGGWVMRCSISIRWVSRGGTQMAYTATFPG